MKLEICSASNFLAHIIRLSKQNVSERQIRKFQDSLIKLLRHRYQNHWIPEKPCKGWSYRCIRINDKMDPIIAQAGEKCGLSLHLLHQIFPSNLTMWIDPREVSYRIDNGYIYILYKYEENITEPWKPSIEKMKKTKKNCGCSEIFIEEAKKIFVQCFT